MQYISPMEYTKIAVANAYGLDKLTWESRQAWVDYNIDVLESVTDADKPLLYKKAVYALRDAQQKVPSGFAMELDASCSGVQLMSAMSGCEIGARNTNLIDTGKREDLYSKIAATMNKEPSINITRAEIKDPVMTFFYNSTAQPKKTFGDGEELKLFYKSLQTEAPGAYEVMLDINKCTSGNVTKYVWELPDGHTSVYKVMVPMDKKIEIDEFDHATFTQRMLVNSPNPRDKSLPANVVHSVDGYVCREMIRRCNFELYTIHDCFCAHPNNMHEVRQKYVEILSDIANSDLLGSILSDIAGQTLKYIKRSTTLGDKILKSEYAIS